MEGNSMKQTIAFLLLAVLLLSTLPVSADAAEKDIIYCEDGSYITVEIITNGSRESGSVTGKKRYTYYSENGSTEWVVDLNGSFTYTGSSATCTSSSVDVTIHDSSWYVVSKYATKSSNKATASVTMGDKPAGTTVLTVPVSLTLQCDPNGNLS